MQRCSIMTFVVRKGLEIFVRTRAINHVRLCQSPRSFSFVSSTHDSTLYFIRFQEVIARHWRHSERRSLVDTLWLRIIALRSITRPFRDSWSIADERTVASPQGPALSRIIINGAWNMRHSSGIHNPAGVRDTPDTHRHPFVRRARVACRPRRPVPFDKVWLSGGSPRINDDRRRRHGCGL